MNNDNSPTPDALPPAPCSGLLACPFCGFEEPSMGIDRSVTCGNCGAKGPWDRDAWGLESDRPPEDEQEMWNRRRSVMEFRSPREIAELAEALRLKESPETDQMMEADRMHWENEQEVSITAYMRMFCMARRMEEERNAFRDLCSQNAEVSHGDGNATPILEKS